MAKDIEGDIASAATGAMRDTTPQAKQELREQVTSNGLGSRLANTWQDKVYPLKRNSVTPGGYIWSNAPDIIDAFERGATIVPTNGRKYLWIPTKSVPRARGGGRATSTKRMTPEQVQREFSQDFVIRKGKAGRLLAFIAKDRGSTSRGALRKVRKGRLGHGAKQELVLMFTLVRAVRLPKFLDLDAVAARWGQHFELGFSERLSRT
ncbi:MAG: DUF6441 family protein [Pseudomonadota bacterium]|nr:DUF6441 family protein [Pseudomonadota bacterium]